MKYVTYFIFFAFVVVFLFFMKNAFEPSKEQVVVIGSTKCGECHGLKNMGDQQSVWEKSRHKTAYQTLLSEKSVEFAKSRNIETPANNELCGKCHTTAFALKEYFKANTYNLDEGVGCEACHGAGSVYYPAELHKDESEFKRNGGEIGDESTCRKCHSPKGNPEQKILDNACPFQKDDFVYKTAFEKIKHPIDRTNFK
jgi:hypothetical protein